MPLTEHAPRIAAPTAEAIAEAARLLREGRLVAFPTETVYGLGADATNDGAVAAVFEAKGRPRFNPLIVHVASADEAERFARLDGRARLLAKAFWPLTLVLPRREPCAISALASAGLETLALRVPKHEVALSLLDAADCPIAAPSANPAGYVSPTTAAHVAEALGERVAMILDGGPCPIGIESTVLDVTGRQPAILRPGAVSREEIEALAGPLAEAGAVAARSPGQVGRHYATKIPLRLGVAGPAREPNLALLAFGPEVPPGYAATLNLSPTGNLREAAANLFAMLRALDRPEFAAIAVMPIPEEGLGAAINDRLRRAAEPAVAEGPAAAHIEEDRPARGRDRRG